MSSQVERCEFLKSAALGAASTVLANYRNDSETLVATLYNSLTVERPFAICLPFGHPPPNMVWCLRGHPLVPTWVNLRT